MKFPRRHSLRLSEKSSVSLERGSSTTKTGPSGRPSRSRNPSPEAPEHYFDAFSDGLSRQPGKRTPSLLPKLLLPLGRRYPIFQPIASTAGARDVIPCPLIGEAVSTRGAFFLGLTTRSEHHRLAEDPGGRDSVARRDRRDLSLRRRRHAARAGLIRRIHHRSGRRPEGLPGTHPGRGDHHHTGGWPSKEAFSSKGLREDEGAVRKVRVASARSTPFHPDARRRGGGGFDRRGPNRRHGPRVRRGQKPLVLGVGGVPRGAFCRRRQR